MPRIVRGLLVGIAVVVADVFIFVEVGEQFLELRLLVVAQLLFILGNLLEFGVFNYYPPLLEALLDFLQVGDSGVDGYAVLVPVDVEDAGVNELKLELIGNRRNPDYSLLFEQPADAARPAQAAAVLAQEVLHCGAGPVAVVGQALDHYRHTGRAKPFVGNGFDPAARELAGAALDGPFDVVLGRVDGLGLVNRQPESEVGFRVAAAGFCRDGHGVAHPGEQGAALGVGHALLAVNLRPL